MKLATSLIAVIQKSVRSAELGTALVTRSKELNKHSTRLKGRQIPKEIYGQFESEAANNAYYDFRDLDAVKMVDNNLELFLVEFEEIKSGLKAGSVSYDSELKMFRQQIERHPDLHYDLAAHKRAPEGDVIASLEWLKQVCW